MKHLMVLSAVLLAFACGKKQDEPKPDPTGAKTVEPKDQKPPEPIAPADVPVTSKSPEAIAAFEQGRALMVNARGPEAIDLLKKAIELDPEFAQAHSALGSETPGPEGATHLAKAVELAAKLPEAERELIAANLAFRNGDEVKAIASLEKVLQLAPGAWRVDIALANFHNVRSDNAAAIKRLEHALSIKPDLAQAHNGLAYAHAGLRAWEPAIAAAKKQVDLLPKEPNPQDTLGEVLLWAGKFDESERAFQAAITLEPKFSLAWQGVGLARAYRGDFKGAYQAFDQRKPSTAPGEKHEALIDSAWIAFAEDKLAQALAALDALDKDPAAKDLPVFAFSALDRAYMLDLTGKPADAAKWYATALTRSEKLSGDAKAALHRAHTFGQLRRAAMAGKPAAGADALVATIDAEVTATPNDKTKLSAAAYAHGLAAWATSGPKDAVAALSKCLQTDLWCKADLALAQRRSGDTAGADATDKLIKETPLRGTPGVYVWTHVGKK